ncbi:MAG: hypothetical protein KatS3mg105_2766 [Gemmatales bacterium]|nr:MAG: hypothetical protein KatS3mg105_2766 [Gemmatales bacterium]
MATILNASSSEVCRGRPKARSVVSTAGPLVGVVSWCGFLFFYGLGQSELYRTESLRAIIAAEFLRSGNWFVPTLYGQPLLTKPFGAYAAIALCSWPVGRVTESTARLPSAFAASCTVLLCFWYFRRHLGLLGGVLAAVLTPMSLAWLDKAGSAEIDMLHVFWVTSAYLFFLRAIETFPPTISPTKKDYENWTWPMLASLCLAGGILTKWTAPVFVYGSLIPFLLIRKQVFFLFSKFHLCGLVLCVLVVAGSFAMTASFVGVELLAQTFWRELAQRFAPSHHHEGYPWLETVVHPLRIWLSALPVSFAAGFVLSRRCRHALLASSSVDSADRAKIDATPKKRYLFLALQCWLWPNVIFWSVFPDHDVRQSLPLFGAISGLAVFVWWGWLTGRISWPFRRVRPAAVLIACAVVWLAAKVVFVHVVMPERMSRRQPLAKAALLKRHVPVGHTLHLSGVKDEGIMFYYGRPVRRFPSLDQLASPRIPIYVILTASEWRRWPGPGRCLQKLQDQQGDDLFLVYVPPSTVP